MIQADFVLELLKKSKEMGLSTAIETSGDLTRGIMNGFFPMRMSFYGTKRDRQCKAQGIDRSGKQEDS